MKKKNKRLNMKLLKQDNALKYYSEQTKDLIFKELNLPEPEYMKMPYVEREL